MAFKCSFSSSREHESVSLWVWSEVACLLCSLELNDSELLIAWTETRLWVLDWDRDWAAALTEMWLGLRLKENSSEKWDQHRDRDDTVTERWDKCWVRQKWDYHLYRDVAGTETKWDQPWDRNKTGIEIEWDSHRKKAKQKWFQHSSKIETHWEKNWLLYNCLHTFSASAYTHHKRKKNSNFANTFAIRLYFWIYHIVIQNLKLFFHEILCTFLYTIMK